RSRPPFFRALHTLTVDDTRRRCDLAIRLFAARDVESIMDLHQRSIVVPTLEVAVNGAARRQVLWQSSPLTASAEDIQNAIQHFTNIDLPLASPALRRTDEGFHQFPFSVRHIARVAQPFPVIPGAVLGRPHKAPRESVPGIESHSIRAGQAPIL